MADFLSGLDLLGIAIPEAVARQETLFLDELLRWNQRVNLTSIRARDVAIEKHLLDSLLLLPHVADADTLLDMGSGGGLPGIPLAIARPKLVVTSVDSVGKKINFQKHIKRKLQLENLHPLQARLEDLEQHFAADRRFSCIVARAFSSLEKICLLALPWLADAGRLLVMKGPEGPKELRAMGDGLAASGFALEQTYQYRLPFGGSGRQLIVLRKQPT
jgi:16S rRNA (guanine527-N7)-methyltransferase